MKGLHIVYTVIILGVGVVSVGIIALWRIIAFWRMKAKDAKSDDDALLFETLCQQYNITTREQDVIRLILQGRRNKEISEDLSISVSTVKKYITRIYQKFDLTSREELIMTFTNPSEAPGKGRESEMG